MKLHLLDYESRMEIIRISEINREIIDVLTTLIIQDRFNFYLVKSRRGNNICTSGITFDWLNVEDINKQFPICYGGEIGIEMNKIFTRLAKEQYRGKEIVVRI